MRYEFEDHCWQKVIGEDVLEIYKAYESNLFDLHHKYADVMHIGEVVCHLNKRQNPQPV